MKQGLLGNDCRGSGPGAAQSASHCSHPSQDQALCACRSPQYHTPSGSPVRRPVAGAQPVIRAGSMWHCSRGGLLVDDVAGDEAVIPRVAPEVRSPSQQENIDHEI